MVLGTRAGAHAMAIFWSWHAKEEVCLRYSVNHERLNHETKRKSRSDDSHEPVKVQAGSRGFPRARTDSKVAHDQARYAKVTAWRGAAQATSSWSLTMSDETSAQLDVMDQALLDTLVQVEHEICELDKVPADKEWTQVHASRYSKLQSLAKGLRSKSQKHRGFSQETKDAQFAAQIRTVQHVYYGRIAIIVCHVSYLISHIHNG
jgi:hypothetical protein